MRIGLEHVVTSHLLGCLNRVCRLPLDEHCLLLEFVVALEDITERALADVSIGDAFCNSLKAFIHRIISGWHRVKFPSRE